MHQTRQVRAADRLPQRPIESLINTRVHAGTVRRDWANHSHSDHELVWCEAGLARMEIDGRIWAIPTTMAVWVPAGTVHRYSAHAGTQLCTTFFSPSASHLPTQVTGVAMSDALRALLLHVEQHELPTQVQERMFEVIRDLLLPVPDDAHPLHLPRSPELREVALAILDDPTDRRTTGDFAALIGVAPRALAQQFLVETGLSMTKWRILARMQFALRELGRGVSVVTVAHNVGYRSVGTFIEHFRELTGQTPAEYFCRALGSRPARSA